MKVSLKLIGWLGSRVLQYFFKRMGKQKCHRDPYGERKTTAPWMRTDLEVTRRLIHELAFLTRKHFSSNFTQDNDFFYLRVKGKIVGKYFLDKIKNIIEIFFPQNKLFLLVEFSMPVSINTCRATEAKLIAKNINVLHVWESEKY